MFFEEIYISRVKSIPICIWRQFACATIAYRDKLACDNNSTYRVYSNVCQCSVEQCRAVSYNTAFPLVLKVTPWKTNGAIGNPLPHWISHTPLEIQPPQKSNGVSEFQWISRLMCSIGIPIPHRNSKHTMNNYFSPLEIQWVFHSFVMDGQRNEHSKTNIDFKSVKIHLGSLENRCPLKPLSCL